MAKIQQEVIVVKISRLLRDTESDPTAIMATEAVESLEAVIQELTGDQVMVEIVRE